MTASARVSVIIVSRGRPVLLKRCLLGLGQLFHPAFEIIVVADPAGLQAVEEMGWSARIKPVPFDAANISAARNAGIAQAAGDIVAFIDDDAVPEPTWLDYLTRPFANPEINAAGGYVRGRNGISFQWQGRIVDRLGQEQVLSYSGDAAFAPDVQPGRAVKTEGTNCAFRRGLLAGLGGFDPAYRFYLDETDLNMRLAAVGTRTAIVPLAQVHHGFAASDRRASDRAPKDLHEIGASSMIYWRKHAPPNANLARAANDLSAGQRVRLIQYMVRGGLEPGTVKSLLAGLDLGLEQGRVRPITPLAPIAPSGKAFLPFRRETVVGASVFLAGWCWDWIRLRRQATERVRAGEVVSVYCFSPSARPHFVRFLNEGFWEQRGGLFGPAKRGERAFRFTTLSTRAAEEWRRVASLRQPLKKSGIPDDGSQIFEYR
jgi:GT2 family glycosyltransferase